ncbi:MAG: phage tail tape measure protein [Azoarcus sp.]|nr:phage tail tape measure protein [Azoarcus sp.]
MDLELRLKLNNQATPGLRRAQQDAEKSAERGAAAQRRASQARERLGIRSENQIQREINRTQAAYRRLAQSGTMSWREQARAAEAMRQRVTALTNEMGRLTARQRAAAAFKGVAAVGAGVAAAGYVVNGPVRKAMDTELRLAYMANTAFGARDKEGRKAGMKELQAAVDNAVRQGGGTRDEAATALDALIASGAVKNDEAISMLPQIIKAATASGASAEEMANIAIRSMQGFGISAQELPRIFNMAIAAGQAGGFELRDMSRWLPQQMAAAKASGMSGREDFAALAALNQAAAITAGTKDEAGNNVANLLGKINSRDTALDVKRFGIDLSKELQDARAKGVNSIDAFGGVVTKVMEKNSSYKKLQAKLTETSDDDEKKKIYESMARIAQGSAMGQVVQDRQALMALMAMINNQGYMQEVRRKVLENDVESGGAVETNLDLIKETQAYLAQQRETAGDIAQQAAAEKLFPAIGAFNTAITDLQTRFPTLAGSLELAAKAAIGFAAAAGIASMIGGGGGGGGVRKVVAGAAAGMGAAARRAVGPKIGAKAVKLVKAATPAGIASLAGGFALDTAFGEESTVARYGGSALSFGGTGAMIGSMIAPGIGTAIGAALGGVGGLIYEGISDLMRDDTAEPQEVGINAQIQLGLPPGFVVTQQIMRAEGGNVQLNTGNIQTGAP